ncbi:hypothetical protein BY458DRAFT_528448 [Sporodiniella umbellata]|nr:hypothetical protein BY458DRAFT_528448 [Sporodiniella umbellata]
MDGHTRKVRLINTTTDILNNLGDAIHLFGRCYQENNKASLTHPTRPKSSYLFFCDQARGKLMKENPDLTSNEIAKLMGLQWRGISDSEREHFHSLYLVEKKRYENELNVYEQLTGSASNKRKVVSLDSTNSSSSKEHVPETESPKRATEETEEDEIDEESEEEGSPEQEEEEEDEDEEEEDEEEEDDDEEEEEDEIEDSDSCSEANYSNNVSGSNQRSPDVDRNWPTQDSDDGEESKYSGGFHQSSEIKNFCEFLAHSPPAPTDSLVLDDSNLLLSAHSAQEDILRLESPGDATIRIKQEQYHTILPTCLLSAATQAE